MDWSIIRWITSVQILLLYWSCWAEGALSGYNDTPTQYHIQTDEGPERFFRFQTFNGQYRKEKRLDDGTVIGSYGWVDPTGFLRMTDYIADAKGYRVVKSRMEYVGVKAMPETTVKETKKYTPMKHSTRVITKQPVFLNALESVVSPQVSNENPTTLKPSVETPTTFSPRLYVSVKPLPKSFETPTAQPNYVRSTPKQQRFQTTTLAPKTNSRTRSPVNEIREEGEETKVKPPRGFAVYARRHAPPPQYFNVADARPETMAAVFPANRFGRYRVAPVPALQEQVDVFRNYTTPLRRSPGFVYKISNQYHKDETEEDGSRTGSFGYVDPFGIRRVIHYNAGRNGFQHAKDFKYVGRQDGPE